MPWTVDPAKPVQNKPNPPDPAALSAIVENADRPDGLSLEWLLDHTEKTERPT